MITLSIMLANIMQGVDNTILNVALPHIQGSLSASQDQIAWALTSYIVCAGDHDAADRLARRPLRHQVRLSRSVIGFTVASALCGIATSLERAGGLPRVARGGRRRADPAVAGDAVAHQPAGAARHAMAVFGMGTIFGPIMGPMLGGWLTEYYSWRWVFYINLPIGVLCTLGIMAFHAANRNVHREAFDFSGFSR